MGDGNARSLADFERPNFSQEWYTVLDGVMGGYSLGVLRASPEGTLVFAGNLSLENGGGFASFRSKPKSMGLLPGDSIRVRVRGDGRTYSMTLYPDRCPTAFSYRSPLHTLPDIWQEISFPLAGFVANSFGRAVSDCDPLNPFDVRALGFLLGDKRPGPFRLELGGIWIAPPGGCLMGHE